MINQGVNYQIRIKILIIVFVIFLCIFLVVSTYFNKPITYYESNSTSANDEDSKVMVSTETNIKQGSIPELASVKTRIDSPYNENWITTNEAISKIQTKNNILSVKSIAPFNSSGQSFGYEILVSEGLYITKYVITGDSNITKKVTDIKAEKINPLPFDVSDSSLAVKVISSNPYFSDKNLIGVVIYFDTKLKSWKYIIRTDAGDVSIPI